MKTNVLCLMSIVTLLSGCASYRTDSSVTTSDGNVSHSPTQTEITKTSGMADIKIYEGSPAGDKKYSDLGKVEVSVKKLTIFHKDPTREQANEALRAKAAELGANAVINVRYESGIGAMTWGYMDAFGQAIRFLGP